MAKIVGLILLLCGSLCAQDTLSENDQREILLRLYELQSARQQVILQGAHIAKLDEFAQRESDLQRRESNLCTSQIQVEQQRVTMLTEQVAFYKQAYEAVTKKRTWKCTIAKIFTLGVARCGP